MKIDPISVNETIEKIRTSLATEKTLSEGLRTMIELLLVILGVLINKGKLTSSNSSLPPSQDPNRPKPVTQKTCGKKPGGQDGHVGHTLRMVPDPDRVVTLNVDISTLPPGVYKDVGYVRAQVVDLEIRRIVTQFQAQIVEDLEGRRFEAPFPQGVRGNTIQYGASVKSHAVYMSQFQMIPYGRLEQYFYEQLGISLSKGTLFNFNKSAYEGLAPFEEIVKGKLKGSKALNVDETSINVSAKLRWIHTAANPSWVHFYLHEKRGKEAMDEEGILPSFRGVMVHDHLKAYYTYKNCQHALCNAHHLRELQAVIDLNGHGWALKMQTLLVEINEVTEGKGGSLDEAQAETFRTRYREILQEADLESPAPVKPEGSKKRGPLKKAKHRNLLERLRNYEDDVLRFMTNKDVPFTNNMAENDLRMIKVHQKIAGCFRSTEGGKIFCRIRSYLLSAQKQGVNPTDALTSLFEGNLHPFSTHPPHYP